MWAISNSAAWSASPSQPRRGAVRLRRGAGPGAGRSAAVGLAALLCIESDREQRRERAGNELDAQLRSQARGQRIDRHGHPVSRQDGDVRAIGRRWPALEHGEAASVSARGCGKRIPVSGRGVEPDLQLRLDRRADRDRGPQRQHAHGDAGRGRGGAVAGSGLARAHADVHLYGQESDAGAGPVRTRGELRVLGRPAQRDHQRERQERHVHLRGGRADDGGDASGGQPAVHAAVRRAGARVGPGRQLLGSR